ncbi:MAG: inositol monophosphatase [Helicobacteraceae bacterium]|nr:inositol monophosphatase [Helicobacteraceae bacterium]
MINFIEATLIAGSKIANILESKNKILYTKHTQNTSGDISIEADLLSEKIFCKFLGKFGNIDSEESEFIDNHKDYTIILDPLDGSDNFLSNIPYYGASIALCNKDLEPQIGIIMNFCTQIVVINYQNKNFIGKLGQNFSDFKMQENSTNSVKCGIFEGAYSKPEICNILALNHIKFRSLGALALSLALANDVNFLLFSGKKRRFDLKAGELITQHLYKIEDKKFTLISKDKELFDKIANLLF